MVIREINTEIVKYLSNNNLYVLRRKKDGVALNVSYTPEGLIWTCNKLGKALMFKNTIIQYGKFVGPRNGDGKLIPDPSVYVEKFIPTNKPTESAQVAECTWVAKAMKLLSYSN